jgi:hypothetical protein
MSTLLEHDDYLDEEDIVTTSLQTRELDINQQEILNELAELLEKGIDTETLNELKNNMLTKNPILILNKRCNIHNLPTVCRKYEWIIQMKIENIGLEILDNFPPNIDTLVIQNNRITDINADTFGDKFNKLEKLSLEQNNISEIDFAFLPQSLIYLDLSDNNIKTICNPSCLISLDKLIINNNKLDNIPKFNSNLTLLDISKNKILKLENLNEELRELDCSNCHLTELNNIPKKLIKLIAYSNNIKYIISLPDTLQVIDLSYNDISFMGHIPQEAQDIDLSHNELKTINFRDIPISLTELNLQGNSIPRSKLLEFEKNNRYVENFIYDDNNGNDISNNFYDSDNRWSNYNNNNNLSSLLNRKEAKKESFMVCNETNPYYIISKRTIKLFGKK